MSSLPLFPRKFRYRSTAAGTHSLERIRSTEFPAPPRRLFEFGFKLMMTGVMVHVKPGTVSQIIAGVAMCFIALTTHLIFQPYKDVSNNLLMGAGKMQLFLTLMLALLLKMETPFFSGNSQMDEIDIGAISTIIISSSALLVISWICAVIYESMTGVIRRRRERARDEEARQMKQKFKRLKHNVIGRNLVKRMKVNMALTLSEDQRGDNVERGPAAASKAGNAKKKALIRAQELREDENLVSLRGFRAGPNWKSAKKKVSLARILAFGGGASMSAGKKKTAVIPQDPHPARQKINTPSVEMKNAVSTWDEGAVETRERSQPPPPRRAVPTDDVKSWGGGVPVATSPPARRIVKKSDRRLSVLGFEAGSEDDEDEKM